MRVLPPVARAGVKGLQRSWFQQVLATLRAPAGPSDAAVVYVVGHAGWYCGKARVRRDDGKARVPARLGERMTALLLPGSRDGKLARYRLLRMALESMSSLPIAWYSSQAHALSVEAAVISICKPRCNGADMGQLRASRNVGQPFKPERAQRKRPPPRLRTGGLSRVASIASV